MDENKSPQDILDEILNRPPDKIPAPVSYPPKFDPPPPDTAAPPAPDMPGKKAAPDRSARLLPWLCAMLGVSLLVTGICVLQVVGVNHRLDGLQEMIEDVRTVDQLRAENEALQNQLEAALDAQQAAEREYETQRDYVDALSQKLNITTIQKWRSDYLFYIGQFMDNGDYPMAAMVAGLSAKWYFHRTGFELGESPPLNPAQNVQYREYVEELADKGYLQLEFGSVIDSSPSVPALPEQYDPSQSPEMASLGILWAALNECYVLNEPWAAAQFLVRYQNHTLGNYLQYLDSTATDYTIRLYERLVSDLTERGYLIENDGVFDYVIVFGDTNIQYHLPFELPQLP